MRRSYPLVFLALVLLSAACSLSGGSTTWEASTSYSPYSPSLSPFAKAENLLADHLAGELLLFAKDENGVCIGCDEYNNWAAVNAQGKVLAPPPSPQGIPASIAVMSDGFLLLGDEDCKLKLDGNVWLLEYLP